ncbi:bifunctional glutamate/proline--tRNA ligase isoform X2 [Athalia rosae]|uniref:bifunctional glutamate/proline--tRNA ligase isoform X2 n=1 Tax=Athalia rosae TaxID=37344 RepID=UPI0020336740|nr:bifunctional glutamate/proline--tRNA ligase isoform X2 [Athalia rosae]
MIKSRGEQNAEELNAKIIAQGDKVRELKAAKADKTAIDQEVKILLALKAEYKSASGADWKPGVAPPAAAKINTNGRSAEIISDEITKQGDKVRILKGDKADKKAIEAEVKVLLNLKAEYKSATGQDWKPGAVPAKAATKETIPQNQVKTRSSEIISADIVKQGDKVRELKGQKADKKIVEVEVKTLLNLKAEYKTVTGQDWKPGTLPVKPTVENMQSAEDISNAITKQGDKVRQLKGEKAGKTVIDQEVKTLLALKAEYKTKTGVDWQANALPNTSAKVENKDSGAEEISNQIAKQGEKVRELKAAKADKKSIDEEVKILLNLKAQYKAASGQDWKPSNSTAPAKEAKKVENQSKKSAKTAANVNKSANEATVKDKDATKTGTRLGLEAKKNENLSDWYSQVITKGEMIEYYDVSGCYVLRPWSYSIWEEVKNWFDAEIKKLGVQNCYFPIFVSRSVLEKEKSHIADFAPEVAWVTKSGETELAEPIAIRPTSETVMYPAYAKWLKSHRDLPLKLNQWNNVVRWEFKHPQPFLRTREFLWQEGHTAFATKSEAEEEVFTILELYAKIYEDLLAIPVVRGRKSEKEKFAGGDFTTTVEAFVSASGRAIQGATSHHLGQNFSKMFDIQVLGADENGEKSYVWQNSWGITTRTIGVMVMIHGDDNGLVLPPKVASVQTVIIPCGITASSTPEQRQNLLAECTKLENELKAGQIKVKGDYRDNYSPGWKFNHWELKGVPLRIELGPKDLEKNQLTVVRRDTFAKVTVPRAQAISHIHKLLEDVQKSLYDRAAKELKEHTKQTEDWTVFCKQLDQKNLLLSPYCGEISCEDNIKADSAREDVSEEPGAPAMGAKTLCIPFKQPTPPAPLESLRCIHPKCTNKPKFYALFGRSY